MNRKSLSSILSFAVGAIVSLTALVVALTPHWRDRVRSLIMNPYREVLRTATGDLFNEGEIHQVVKIRSNQGMFVEIYGAFSNNTRPLVDRVQLPDKRDGFFHFQNQATNLALDDIDGNGTLEIIAPTFDENLNGRLNVLTFNPDTRKFETFTR